MRNRPGNAWATMGGAAGALAVLTALGAVAPVARAADTDGDGMSDGYEVFFGLDARTDDAAADRDGDGLANFVEAARGTDPFIADTDCDGFVDAADSHPVSRAVIPWGDPVFTRTNETFYTWPAWMVAAFKMGGGWDTNLPGWRAAGVDGGGVCLEVNRAVLTNDLRMQLWVAGGAGAGLCVDLYDTNGAVLATNVMGNLLQDPGTGSVKVLSVPLESNSWAVGLWIRHTAGEVTIGETVLYVDRDGDGLDAEQERQLGSFDTCSDSDADGIADGVEAGRGTDPANPAHRNAFLYGNSDAGHDGFDGLSALAGGGHGPKRTLVSAIDAAYAGDTIQLTGEAVFAGVSLGGKSLVLKPVGDVVVRP